ncbi:Rho GTPase-activating protein 26 [Halotydeus destructor]|nr:Rho GTPase-activating protein 26 [Halotydeus destructor]
MMGLLPLEFTDCLSDSPYFRENLHSHEKELDKTSQQIKGLIKEVKDLLTAAKTLSRAQRNLANTLSNFTFDCIGGSQTDDEIIIAGSLKEFGRLLSSIEDERDRMLERASATFIDPIDKFRHNHIGGAKEGKKKFDKETTRFCSSLERHLNLSTKKSENQLQEADASLEMEQRHFVQASLEYVLKLQEVQERKKFEFVETILSFMYGWLTFYHQGHEAACEFKSFMTDLQVRLQRTRENYTATQNEAENLMQKMLEARKTRPQDPGTLNKMYTRQGYLFLMEKKAFGTTWLKHFCQYQKENRRFTMIPYNQTISKITSTETITLKECIRRMSDSIDKRFCFDIIPVEKSSAVYTFQALSEEDRKMWLDAMDGKDPLPSSSKNASSRPDDFGLDELGHAFVQKCIEIVEVRGLDDQGLYRVGGVASKVNKLIQSAMDNKKNSDGASVISFDVSEEELEMKTVTSALKQYFRNLPEPLMTYRLHQAFIAAAKQENRGQRIDLVHCLVHTLPKASFDMLHVLIRHLLKVANNCEKNLMTVSNLGVCFGPTLLRPEEESVAAIMDIKFGNVVVEILIENCDKIFTTKPTEMLPKVQPTNHSSGSAQVASVQPNAYYPQNQYQGAVGQQQQAYSRAPISDSASSTYATVPTRGSVSHNQVYRSNSHGQLSGQPLSVYQQQRESAQSQYYTGSSGPIYGQTAPMFQRQPSYVQPMSNGPPQPQRFYRPAQQAGHLSHYNSQPNILQAQTMSTSAGDQVLSRKLSPGHSSGSSSAESTSSPQTYYPATPSSSPLNQQHNQQIYGSIRPPPPPQHQLHAQHSYPNSSNSTLTSTDYNGVPLPLPTGRKVRTLYACIGENATELSFEPNVIIFNVRTSKEPGWLEGFYKGRTGLIPQNYVQFID